MLALVFRILLLSLLVWLIGLTEPVITVKGIALFMARHHPDRRRPVPDREGDPRNSCRGRGGREASDERPGASAFFWVIMQIIVIDMVFSLDSIITAIGMAQDLEIMVAAVVIACVIMYISSGPVARFVAEHPTTKMLALAFLVLIGVALVADGFKFHIPRGYIYFAIMFSAAVEFFNVLAKRNRGKAGQLAPGSRCAPWLTRPPRRLSVEIERSEGEAEMTKAVRVHKVGGPEVLVYEAVDVPAPAAGEVRIRQHAVGLNFIDVYFRTGLYKAPGLPFIAGNEAAGEVIAVGPGVTNFHPGDRVAYYFNLGGYASERNIPWDKLVKLPDHITYEQGAVLMLKGLTVWYLLHKTFKIEPHHRVLIHAAAGGIGLLACQWARALGAHVIGTVGSKAKAELALSNGCDHVIIYNEEDFVERVKQISRNELCDVVYDGVGKTTFPGSLSCLKRRGMFVSFGNASGPVPPFAIAELNNHGSLFATRPKLNDYVANRKELLEGADTVFSAVINGKLHVPINHAYALKDAARAHTDLESRATTGAVILRP